MLFHNYALLEGIIIKNIRDEAKLKAPPTSLTSFFANEAERVGKIAVCIAIAKTPRGNW